MRAVFKKSYTMSVCEHTEFKILVWNSSTSSTKTASVARLFHGVIVSGKKMRLNWNVTIWRKNMTYWYLKTWGHNDFFYFSCLLNVNLMLNSITLTMQSFKFTIKGSTLRRLINIDTIWPWTRTKWLQAWKNVTDESHSAGESVTVLVG